ncbi:MAG: diaminopimelate epimerase [Chloroflexota bacterium]
MQPWYPLVITAQPARPGAVQPANGAGAIDFVKMQGAGNDFVVIDGRHSPREDWPRVAERLCDRHFGVGADGLLLIEPSNAADVRMRMWNPDGTEAEMCGNGIRCFARHVMDGLPAGRDHLTVETGAGLKMVRDHPGGWIEVGMGKPILKARDIPVESDTNPPIDLALPGLDIRVACVSMGNPHAVLFVDDVWAVDLAELGPRVEHHPLFPNQVNFHLCQVEDSQHLRMRSWERGAGLTLACGTGACATAVAARVKRFTGDVVTVRVPGGTLELAWDGQGEVLMAGPAETVFTGRTWPVR